MPFGSSPSPRPARGDRRLGRLLLSLEDDPTHEVPVERWAALLASYDPAGHAEPPPPPPSDATGRAAIVELYRHRVASGQSLFAEGDRLELLAGEYWRIKELLRLEREEEPHGDTAPTGRHHG